MITAQKKDILKIKNGTAFNGARNLEVFVVEGDQAFKTKVTKGLSNSDYVEITSSNLKEGQRVIISDTEDYDHLDQFTIKKK